MNNQKQKLKQKIQGFIVTEGPKQGGCLSPTFFKIYFECILSKWKKKC